MTIVSRSPPLFSINYTNLLNVSMATRTDTPVSAAPKAANPSPAIDTNDIDDWRNRVNIFLDGPTQAAADAEANPPVEKWHTNLFGYVRACSMYLRYTDLCHRCCTPFETCCVTSCCPCITFGKTYHRMNKDSTMKGYSPINTTVSLTHHSLHSLTVSSLPLNFSLLLTAGHPPSPTPLHLQLTPHHSASSSASANSSSVCLSSSQQCNAAISAESTTSPARPSATSAPPAAACAAASSRPRRRARTAPRRRLLRSSPDARSR